MSVLLSITVGVLFAGGVYLLLQRTLMGILLGIAVLGQAVNLFIFTVGGLTRVVPPIIPGTADTLPSVHADPLPQALILTAIVIGMGLQAFLVALLVRTKQTTKADDSDMLRATEWSS